MKRPARTLAVNLLAAALLAAAAWPAGGAARIGTIHADGPGDAGPAPSGQGAAAANSITGRVVGDGGEPMAQVAVLVSGRGVQRTVNTDEEGNFVVADLPPGVYTLVAAAPGYYGEAASRGDGAGAGLRPGDSATVRLLKGGVVTGTVTDPQGEPIVAMPVRAYRVRSLEAAGAPAASSFSPFGVQGQTDDRGVYRIYGLTPGVYVVAAGVPGPGLFLPYEGDSPTFYPSSTRDTAAEVTVRAGQEMTGVDIRYREERGYRVSGAVEFPADIRESNITASVSVVHPATGATVATGFAALRDGARRFQVDGVPEGEYEVRASAGTPDGAARTSAPRRVSVRGADVTGLQLTLTPLASLSGTLTIEPPAAALRESELCRANAPAPRLLAQEVMLTARPEAETRAGQAQRPAQFTRSASTPDDAGAFSLRNLEAGRYRLEARPLDESLYVRLIQPPRPAPATAAPSRGASAPGGAPRATATPRVTRPAPVIAAATGDGGSREAVALGAGQQVSGITVRVAYGAALLSGRLAPAEGAERAEGAAAVEPPPARARVYLVPAEAERADDPLRYAEAPVSNTGTFVFRNVAPGRYLLAVRAAAAPASDAPETPPFWNAERRAALRREAEAARLSLDLQPCQRLTGFALPFPAPAAPQK